MTMLLTLSIGIGLTVSLLFAEFLGLTAGGMVVPGYIALFLDHPIEVCLTIVAGIGAYGIVSLGSTMMIVYGRRRTVLMILIGFLLGIGLENLPADWQRILTSLEGDKPGDVSVIGYIIPGLIGIWIDRQGLVETLSVLLTSSVVVRLILIVMGVPLAG